jgi:hypothetical protein
MIRYHERVYKKHVSCIYSSPENEQHSLPTNFASIFKWTAVFEMYFVNVFDNSVLNSVNLKYDTKISDFKTKIWGNVVT